MSDEDLFHKAQANLEKLHATGKPFFRLVFSSSNHSPFEYPDHTIEQYDVEKRTVNNAVKYADHALGEFIATAQNSDYWQDTLFLIVADIEARRIKAVTLRPDQAPLAGIYSTENGRTKYLATTPDAAAVKKALAHALLPLTLYREQLYGLP